MLTLEEQILFLKKQRKDSIQNLKNVKKQFGDRYSHIFLEKMNHNIFCYDSVLSSLRELQSIKNTSYGK
ncbi:hypothetical protein [Aquimarina sp. MMG016]|uniref:hypothetical protein n=1 Tax=Aquimarina sp. MMG016 TaxID=2822690 RepID=UPI001B3A5CBB|nr:hypothetical protein [Aquimarina sp. MMG016]MBQ4818864.1 hypothetical protein [Aquimarina sp. MMG016]